MPTSGRPFVVISRSRRLHLVMGAIKRGRASLRFCRHVKYFGALALARGTDLLLPRSAQIRPLGLQEAYLTYVALEALAPPAPASA